MRGQERELCGLAYIVGVSLISKAVPRTHGEVDPLKGLTLAMGCFLGGLSVDLDSHTGF